MEKNNGVGKKVAIVLIYAVGLAYSAVFFVSAYVSPLSILIGVLGLLFCYLFNALIHESGHLIFAKIFGFKPIKFSFSFFNFDLTQKRLKIYLKWSDYAGETDVIPTRSGNYKRRYTAVLLGGLFGGFIASFFLAAMFFLFLKNGYISGLFAFFPLAFSSFLINVIPSLIPNSDGAFIKAVGDEKNEDGIEAYFEVLYLLNEGKTFAEMPNELFFERDCDDLLYQESKLCELMLFEEEDDRDRIKKLADDLFSVRMRQEDVGRELVYAYSVLGDREKVNALEAEIASCDRFDDLRSKRALIAYAKLREDDAYVKVAKPTALRGCDGWYLRGEGLFNRKLIEKL